MEFLASLMATLAAGSLLGVFIATFLERLVPVLPSHLLMLGIGIAAQRLEVSLAATVLVTLLGSALGGGIYFFAGRRLGTGCGPGWRRRFARLPGLSPRRLRRGLVCFRRNAAWMSVVSQLAPGLRLVAPAMAGAIGIPALVYFPFAVSGMAIWNLSFVATGHFAAQYSPQVQAASIAAIVIGAFVAIQLLGVCAWWAWRRLRRMKTTPNSSRGTHARVAGE